MENELLFQLGINWKLLLSQAVNFFVLLIVLTFFVYKPLLKVIKSRNQRIQEGLEKADQADVRLKEIDNIAKEKIKIAEAESIEIVKTTEGKAKEMEKDFQKKFEEDQKKATEQVKLNAQRMQEEANKAVLDKAAELVKKAIVKTIGLRPDAIDDALIKKAVKEVENRN